MLDFVAKVYRGWVNFILVITLIGCVIIGGVLGGLLSFGDGGYIFLGILLGGFIGFIIIILGGGYIANFLNMVDNVEKQNILLIHLLGKDIPENELKSLLDKAGVKINENVSVKTGIDDDDWICKKCSETNRATSLSCKGCGEYRVGQITPTPSGEEYVVNSSTFIRNNPNPDANVEKTVFAGDKVFLQKVSNENPNLFFVKTLDGKEGWCDSANLKKV